MSRRVDQVAGWRLSRRTAVWAVAVVAGGAALSWGGRVAWETYQSRGTPACSWPLQVRGTASPDGVRQDAAMMNMAAMGGPPGWRMSIGTGIHPDSGPSPATSEPGAASPG